MPRSCKKCDAVLNADNTYVSNRTTCKECVKRRVRENRRENLEYYQAYDRKRYRDDPDRKAHCIAMGKTTSPERKREYMVEQRREHPEKVAARRAVAYHKKQGNIQPDPCFFCGTTENLHAHHEDYSNPLDIVWLCASCHGKLHTIKGDLRRGDAA